MDYQKKLMEISEMAEKREVEVIVKTNEPEERLAKEIFLLMKIELKEHLEAKERVPLDITIDIDESSNHGEYALGKSEEDPKNWSMFIAGTSREVFKQEMLKEICDKINSNCKKSNITNISARISEVWNNLVISID